MATIPAPDAITGDADPDAARDLGRIDVDGCIDVVDGSRPSSDGLPRPAILLGCRTCGLPAQEHGRSVIHRFVRPDLASGYRYLDEVGTGDELALRRRPPEQPTIVATGPDPIRSDPTQPALTLLLGDDGLLRARTARRKQSDPRPVTTVGQVPAA